MTERPQRWPPLPLPLAVLVALPGTSLGAAYYLGLPNPQLPAPVAALVYGTAIIGAAFVLSWAAEAAQVDISAGLALALLVLLAVLPEYAVDFVACLYAARLHAADSLGTLLSSKVNQWTLLVGTIPLVFALSSGSLSGLPLDDQQRSELLLTAAQSLFAVSILITLALSTRAAVVLFVLFAVQFLASLLLPAEIDRMVVLWLSGLYLLLALVQFVRHRRELLRTTRDGLRTPFAELADDKVAAAS